MALVTVPRGSVPGGAWLSVAERTAMAELPHEWRRGQWAEGRLAAKLAVCRLLGWPACRLPEFSVVAGPRGMPELEALPAPVAVRVSIAHKERIVVAAASLDAVGIDVEDEDEQLLDLLPRFSAPEDTVAANARQAAGLWALKEAAIKAGGPVANRRAYRVSVCWDCGRAEVRCVPQDQTVARFQGVLLNDRRRFALALARPLRAGPDHCRGAVSGMGAERHSGLGARQGGPLDRGWRDACGGAP